MEAESDDPNINNDASNLNGDFGSPSTEKSSPRKRALPVKIDWRTNLGLDTLVEKVASR